jgi:dCMP deaminase
MKRNNYMRWNEYFMGIAELSAQRSKDPNTQVGACIIDPKDNHILSIGYNGLPRGFNDDEFPWERSEDFIEDKLSYIVHAEANAILNATSDIEGSELYVTMFPCNECAKLISQSGIKKVIYRDDKFLLKKQGPVSMKIFEKAGIVVEKYNGGEIKIHRHEEEITDENQKD